MKKSSLADKPAIPRPFERRWPWLIRLFSWYTRRFLRRHFHALRLAKQGWPPELPDGPLIVSLSHPSWWDPLVGVVLAQLFPDKIHCAPIEAAALAQYRFFERLGFFGIEPGSRRGWEQLLGVTEQVVQRPDAAMWITPQGHFADVRLRPISLRPGIGHIAARMQGGAILPLAIEYVFWNERLPEITVQAGQPIEVADGSTRSPEEWTELTASKMEGAQDQLATAVMNRSADAFHSFLRGRSGVGGIYDLWRRFVGKLTGRKIVTDHDQVVQLAMRLREEKVKK